MSDRYVELELKFSADHVNEAAFLGWAVAQNPERYDASSCPDLYYVNGTGDTVRHRWSSKAGELTVKQRLGRKSIVNRVEVDLKFHESMEINDVTQFLLTSGFKRLFTLYKTKVHVFWYQTDNATVTLSLYGVKLLNDRTGKCGPARQFLEVEAEKGSKLSDAAARILLEKWHDTLKTTFNLGTPLNESLFEIYSDRTYKLASKGKKHGRSNKKKGV